MLAALRHKSVIANIMTWLVAAKIWNVCFVNVRELSEQKAPEVKKKHQTRKLHRTFGDKSARLESQGSKAKALRSNRFEQQAPHGKKAKPARP